jgi:uncharacterized SAM-binding protein YcdF (DUF218 family)
VKAAGGVFHLTAFELRQVLKALLLPPGGPLLLGLVGLLWARRLPRLALTLCGIAIVSLTLLSTSLVGDALARSAEEYPALDLRHLTPSQSRSQAIVILGGGVRHDAPESGADEPSARTGLRLIEGARIARATRLPILVSGTAQEARAMSRFLDEDLQVPVRWAESASTNTHENAVFSAKLLHGQGIDRIILVTSSAHMKRAAAEFSAAGLEVAAAPAEMWTSDDRGVQAFMPSLLGLSRSQVALYEFAGRLVR